MRVLTRNQPANVMVLLVDTDHVTGKTALSLTVTISKDGGAFTAIALVVTERGSGWYVLALTAAHLDTLGDLVLHITAAGADPADVVCQVVAYNPNASADLGLSRLDGSISSRLATSAYVAPDNASLGIVHKILRNKTITDPVAGTITVYDDDGSTPYLVAQLYQDAAGTRPYNGQGADRRERLA